MFCHGLNTKNHIPPVLHKLKKKARTSSLKYSRPVAPIPVQAKKQNFYLYNPPSWNSIILRNTLTQQRVIIFSNNVYFFNFTLPWGLEQVYYDLNTSLLVIHTSYNNPTYRSFWSTLELTFASFYKPFFKKIKFKGKGYYIYKNKRNIITPQFGYSHRLYLYSYFTSVKFLSKTSIFVFGLVKTDVLSTSWGIKRMRPINIFTGRGVRFARQVIYKKVGKVSSYR